MYTLLNQFIVDTMTIRSSGDASGAFCTRSSMTNGGVFSFPDDTVIISETIGHQAAEKSSKVT
jgi:hypothetical protein